MQIVIDIPEGTKRAIDMGTINQVLTSKVWAAIKNGTPLPEHHGRLGDLDALEQEMIIAEDKAEGDCDYYMADVIDRAKEYIIDAETIIPATKEEKHCKACKYSDNGMINVESERCKACYYDGRLSGNCLFVPKQTAAKEGDGE